MAKKMYYFFKVTKDVINYRGCGTRLPKNMTEVSKEDYDKYQSIIDNIEDKEGYVTVITMYIDFSYTVDYVPIEED